VKYSDEMLMTGKSLSLLNINGFHVTLQISLTCSHL
jgi:hypothetical protein